MAEQRKKQQPEEVSPSAEPVTVSRDAPVQIDLPRLHVWPVKGGWLWRFDSHGETIVRSKPDEPYPTRHRAIEHADKEGDKRFANWQGGARVNVDAGPAED
jgi:hypothetical protein